MSRITVCALLLVAACDRGSPAPQGREAPHGLPPLEGASVPPAIPGAAHGDLPPGHPPVDPADPHAGLMQGATRPQPVDPNAYLEGTLDVAPALKDQVKPGDVIFLSAKAVDAAGNVQRVPVAAIRLDAGSFPMSFRLTGANVMMGGEFKGTMMLTARVDRDAEAMTRQPGDIEGSLQATIPAKDLKIVLDTPVER